MDIVYRLLSRIKVTPAGCFEWQGATCVGYGRLRIGKDVIGAHRVSYETFRRPIPAGLFVCHHCDNPACINPAHLFLGTNMDNIRDAQRKGRLNGVNEGVSSPGAKLTPSQVLQIRDAWKAGARQKILASQYGVCKDTIGELCRRQTWKHI